MMHLGRICAEKERRRRHKLTADHGEVQREVMPVCAPAPRLRAARRTENAEIVQLGIAIFATQDLFNTLGLAQDRFERDDLLRARCAPRTEPSIEEAQR